MAEVQALCLQWNIPFYSYRLPYGKHCFFGGQLEGEVERFGGMEAVAGREGFVVMPFRETVRTPSLFVRREVSFTDRPEDSRLPELLEKYKREVRFADIVRREEGKEAYVRRVREMIAILRRGVVEKMVLSRSLSVACDARRLSPLWFGKLAEKYPEAFVFLVSVPGVTLWMGATPEIFLQQDGEGIRTMALAGTRRAGEQMPWGEKEREEQQIVARYLTALLQAEGDWRVDGPFSKRAGEVEHLCTSFGCGRNFTAAGIDRLRVQLHPTPAVGGFPVPEALELLQRIEGYDRRYYAGYLGPVGRNAAFHWFVNLRCMEVFSRAVRLYVGGGITALSDPEREWQETEMKARTLLEVIGGDGLSVNPAS